MSWLGALKRRPRVSEKLNFKKVAVHLLKFDFIWQTAPKYFVRICLCYFKHNAPSKKKKFVFAYL